MSRQVFETIRARIASDGPIDVATYMELALYGPGGYYEEPPVGVDGDFVTSPHVHDAFGTFVARALASLADDLPAADTGVDIVEVGAGDGTLARQILAAGIGRPVGYTAVEVSAGARAALAEIDGVALAERPVRADLVLAHELLDNLPFRLVRGGVEVRVDVEDDRLVEREAPIDDELRGLLGDADTTDELVVPVGAFAMVQELSGALDPGYALLIDYGREGDAGGPVHGYRDHRLIEDILASPGETDITAGVDISWIARHAEACGLASFGSVTQRDALLSLGFEPWYRGELERQQRDLRGGRGLEAVRTWSGRSRAMLLVDPTALGRMRWLVLGSPGLPTPRFLTAMQDRTAD